MAKTLKEILKQKKWTPRDLGLAVLYNLEKDLTYPGENYPPLFPQSELNKMVNTIGEEGRPELEVYHLLNHTFANNRNLIMAYVQLALHGYYKYVTCISELSREATEYYAKISPPLIITQEHYDQLAEQLINKIGAEQVSYSDILFRTLAYFLEEYKRDASTLPPSIRAAIDETKKQAVVNPRIAENFIEEMQLGYYVEYENGKPVNIPVEEIERYREERDRDKPELTEEQEIELKSRAARTMYEGELAVIEKLRNLPEFILNNYPKMNDFDVRRLLAKALQYELYPDTKDAAPPTLILFKELPAGITKYNIIADCLELYNGATENFIKDGFNITVKAREQFKEFKKDYPGLYAALDAYIREQVPAAAELKANQLHKPITTMNDLLHAQYMPIIEEFDFDNIRLQELFPTDSEEDYITRRKILNGVAILSEPVNAFHKATDYKGGIFAPEEFVTAFISFKDLIEKTEASKFVISAYESLENACRMIYAYNAFCEILLDLFDLPFLKIVYEDMSFLEQKIETANKLIYSIYLDPPGSPIRKEQARKAMKEMLKPIDCEAFKPAKWKVEQLRSRMFFALQEGFEEIRGYLIASRQLMKQLAKAEEEEEGAE
jgi:hypothetical protein